MKKLLILALLLFGCDCSDGRVYWYPVSLKFKAGDSVKIINPPGFYNNCSAVIVDYFPRIYIRESEVTSQTPVYHVEVSCTLWQKPELYTVEEKNMVPDNAN